MDCVLHAHTKCSSEAAESRRSRLSMAAKRPPRPACEPLQSLEQGNPCWFIPVTHRPY
eukprot:COSAG05_NODE_2416_length_3091_cov_4.257994_2_plen_58_part_00